MKIRRKVYLIRGGGVSEKITLGEFQRINTDRIVLLMLIRHPECMPHEFSLSEPNKILEMAFDIAKGFSKQERHLFSSEYAQFITDLDINSIQAVEGQTMTLDWVYKMVKSMHKAFGKPTSEVITFAHTQRIYIEGIDYSWEDGIKVLAHPTMLG